MKQATTLIITLFIINVSFAQIPKLKQIQNLTNSQLIIGLSGNKELDKNFKEIVEKYWDLCPVIEELPLKTARNKAKENDNLFVIYIDSYTSRSFKKYMGTVGNTSYYFRNISSGYFIGLSTGKKKPIMSSGIPAFDKKITDEVIAHGTNYMQQLFRMMLDNNVNAMKTFKIIKENSTKLKEKTLYIPEWWIDNKLSKTEISELYDGNYQIVTHFEWSTAILDKKPGIAYSMIIPASVGGKYVYQHHLCDAETGQIYGITQPKAGAGEMFGVNLSSSNKGYVSKKNIKQYNKVLNGK